MEIRLHPHQMEPMKAMWAAWEAKASGVYLVGPPGAGKTYMARQLVAMTGSHKRLYFNALEIAFEALAAMNKNSGARSAWELIQEVKTAEVILIDDAGRERGEHGRDVVFSLIDQARGFLILTSNRNKKDLADLYGGDEGLRSRLSALVTIEVEGPNLRKA